jgi:hypothetical protein
MGGVELRRFDQMGSRLVEFILKNQLVSPPQALSKCLAIVILAEQFR